MKKVLIITPNFPPISCPDLHRVRMALPFFSEFDWQPLILKIDPDEQEGIKDEELCKTIPDDLKTWQSGYIPKKWVRWFGLNSIGLRSIFHLAHLGDRIIKQEKPDVIFFSTTMFPLMLLGRYWHWRYKIPYVLDFQDPWLSDYQGSDRESIYRSWKYKLSQLGAKFLEPLTVKAASQIISVSSYYVETFLTRYPSLTSDRFTVLPFGAAETDFQYLEQSPQKQSLFDRSDSKQHWVYVGRGGNDMSFALRCLFAAIQKQRKQNYQYFSKLELHFIGTNYAPGKLAKKNVEPIAAEFGVEDLVREYPHRIPYFEALQCLLDADVLIVPGSDDPGYSASKIYPYILAKKPLLAIFHEQSGVVKVLESTQGGKVVTFQTEAEPETIARAIEARLPNLTQTPDTNWTAFNSYTARHMCERLCSVFDSCLSQTTSESKPAETIAINY